MYSIWAPSKSSFIPLSHSLFCPHPFYLTFKTIALHPLSLLLQIFSTVWTASCILNQLVFCFIMLLKHFLFSYVSVCLFSAPAQGEPGGVYQSTTDSEARQIQWRSECFHFSLHPAHQRPGSLLGIRYGEMQRIVFSVVFSLLSWLWKMCKEMKL